MSFRLSKIYSIIVLNKNHYFISQETPHLIKTSHLATRIVTVLYRIDKSYEKGKKNSHILLINFQDLFVLHTQRFKGAIIDQYILFLLEMLFKATKGRVMNQSS